MMQLILAELLVNRRRLQTYQSSLSEQHNLKDDVFFWATLQYNLALHGLLLKAEIDIASLAKAINDASFENIVAQEPSQYFAPCEALSRTSRENALKGKGRKNAWQAELWPNGYQYLITFISFLPITLRFEPHTNLLPLAPIPDPETLDEYIRQILGTLHSLEPLLIDSQANVWLTIFPSEYAAITKIYQSNSNDDIFPEVFLEWAQTLGWYIIIVKGTADHCAKVLATDTTMPEHLFIDKNLEEICQAFSSKGEAISYGQQRVVHTATLFQPEKSQQEKFCEALATLTNSFYPRLQKILSVPNIGLQSLLEKPPRQKKGLYVYHKKKANNQKHSLLVAVKEDRILHIHFFALEGEWTVENLRHYLKKLRPHVPKIHHFHWHAKFLSPSNANDYWSIELHNALEDINQSFSNLPTNPTLR